VKGRHWHAGVEDCIRVLKRAHGLGRCLAERLSGFQYWVGLGLIAGNLSELERNLWSYWIVKVQNKQNVIWAQNAPSIRLAIAFDQLCAKN
jgi:hypothetical protein